MTDPRRLTLLLACVGLMLASAEIPAAPWQELFDLPSPDRDEESGPAKVQLQPRAGSRPATVRPVGDIEHILAAHEAAAEPQADLADGDATFSSDPLLMVTMRQSPSEAEDVGEPAGSEAASSGCAADAKACREALEQLRLDRISEIDLDIKVDGVAGNDYPCECRLEGETFVPRRFATTTFTWKAAGYCHKPLYFEHWNFERYGHSYGWAADPFISAAHFFGTLPILPYKMGVELPWECVYPVGYYRPGDCAPWTVPAFPISARGFAVEAATATGLVFLLP